MISNLVALSRPFPDGFRVTRIFEIFSDNEDRVLKAILISERKKAFGDLEKAPVCERVREAVGFV
jgi:hypothetical protein